MLDKSTLSDSLLNDIERGEGYSIFALSQDDYQLFYQLVFEQYLHVLQGVSSGHVAKYFQSPMSDYHRLYDASEFVHSEVWSKNNRVLGPMALRQIESSKLWQTLKTYFGQFLVSDEENYGWGNVYWRIVRPGKQDVGPVHADKWFWDLGHGSMPEGYCRYKLWLALEVESGASGLRVVPHSHKSDEWKYHGEMKHGQLKPVIDELDDDLDLCNLEMTKGECVVFHDKLLHGGMPNLSDQTRVSLEFTILSPESAVEY